MRIKPIKTKIFKEGEDLVDFIGRYVKHLPERSVLVITSKIVALSEGRVVIGNNQKAKARLIKQESQWALATPLTWLSFKDGMLVAAAGIDESNANGKMILLPRDSFLVAYKIWRELQKKFRVKNLGVLITDSRLLPLRAGAVGFAVGYAGFCGVRDYRGRPDIFGRKLKISQTDVADSLATAAVVVMGEGAEKQPLALIDDAPVKFTAAFNPDEIKIRPKDDIYWPLLKKYLGRNLT